MRMFHWASRWSPVLMTQCQSDRTNTLETWVRHMLRRAGGTAHGASGVCCTSETIKGLVFEMLAQPLQGHKPLWYLALLTPKKETQLLVGILGFGAYKSYHWEYYPEPETHRKLPALNGAQSRPGLCSPAATTTWPASPCGIRGTEVESIRGICGKAQ